MNEFQNTGWIDVSTVIGNNIVHWPDNVPVSITKSSTIDVNGAVANVSAITMSVHTGTHIDAPLHFYKDGADVTHANLQQLMGPAKVLHVADDNNEITYEIIKGLGIEEGDRILFRSRNSDTEWDKEPFNEYYVRLSPDAANYLVKTGVQCVGVDYLSVAGGERGGEVHRTLLGKPVSVVEGLKLNNIEAGNYYMLCLPLKIEGADGAPARVLIQPIA